MIRPLSGKLALEDYLVLAAAVLLPWAFGGVEIWAFRSAALLLVGAAAVAVVRGGAEGLGLDRGARWLLPALLLGLWAVVQVVPLPPAAVGLLSPTADALYRDTFPGYPASPPEDLTAAIETRALERVPEAAGLPEPSRRSEPPDWQVGGSWTGWRPLSLLPSAGVERIHWYFALLAGFLVVRRRCFDPEVGRLYARALLIGFVGLAIFGLVYAATSNGKLYWVRSVTQRAPLFGPYVNANNFAGAMELGIPWLVGYLAMRLRERGLSALRDGRAAALAAGALVCILADLATASKSSPAIVAGCLAVLIVAGVRGFWPRLVALFGGAAAVAGAALLLRYAVLGERVRQYLDIIGGDPTQTGRIVGWKSMWDMVPDYFASGTGFGSFRDVASRYMPAGEYERWAQAHNDYLEVLIEGGAVAGILLLWLTLAFWSRALRHRVLRGDEGWNLEALGLVLGVAALAVHAAFDFNHQIPGNALLFVVMAALVAARADGTGPPGEGRE
jgi:O-antigen ligase